MIFFINQFLLCLLQNFDFPSPKFKGFFEIFEVAAEYNVRLFCCFQIVDGQLFSGSMDTSLKVWDVTGLRDIKPSGDEDNTPKWAWNKDNQEKDG